MAQVGVTAAMRAPHGKAITDIPGAKAGVRHHPKRRVNSSTGRPTIELGGGERPPLS